MLHVHWPFSHGAWLQSMAVATGLVTARWLGLQLMHCLGAGHYAAFRSLRLGKVPEEQTKREANWRLSFLVVWLEVVLLCSVGLIDPTQPWFTWEPLLLVPLVHMFLVEPVYYVFHVLAHHPRIYHCMHQWHHLSVEATAWTSVCFRAAEHLIYDVMFALPVVLPGMVCRPCLVTTLGYFLFFDAANAFGHTNFEVFRSRYLDSILFPFFYTPSFHRVHHTHFRSNYALFMPLWDMLFGTYNREATLANLKRAEENRRYQYKLLAHPSTLASLLSLQGACSDRPPLALSWLEWPAAFLAAVVMLLYLLAPLDLPLSVLCIREHLTARIATHEFAGACHLVPSIQRWYHSRALRGAIARYLRWEIIRTQREHPECRCLCLAGWNQEETLNGGGQKLLEQLLPRLTTLRLIHGKTMTAAACVQAAADRVEARGLPKQVFVTSSSELGLAVAWGLTARGYKVLILGKASSVGDERIDVEQPELVEWVASLAEGRGIAVWMVCEPAAAQVLEGVPDEVELINCAFPSAFDSAAKEAFEKRGVQLTEGALFRYKEVEDLKAGHCLHLPRGVFHAGHVAAVVHSSEGWDFHEVGKVDVARLSECLDLAAKYGFELCHSGCLSTSGEVPATPPGPHRREISREELATRRAADSCWVAINGVVYDLTNFLDQHPGGSKPILKAAGSDATKVFERIHPAGTLEVYGPRVVGVFVG